MFWLIYTGIICSMAALTLRASYLQSGLVLALLLKPYEDSILTLLYRIGFSSNPTDSTSWGEIFWKMKAYGWVDQKVEGFGVSLRRTRNLLTGVAVIGMTFSMIGMFISTSLSMSCACGILLFAWYFLGARNVRTQRYYATAFPNLGYH